MWRAGVTVTLLEESSKPPSGRPRRPRTLRSTPRAARRRGLYLLLGAQRSTAGEELHAGRGNVEKLATSREGRVGFSSLDEEMVVLSSVFDTPGHE